LRVTTAPELKDRRWRVLDLSGTELEELFESENLPVRERTLSAGGASSSCEEESEDGVAEPKEEVDFLLLHSFLVAITCRCRVLCQATAATLSSILHSKHSGKEKSTESSKLLMKRRTRKVHIQDHQHLLRRTHRFQEEYKTQK